MDLYDVDAVEKAQASLDALINSRSKAKEKASAEEELWRASERRHRERRREQNRQAWHAHEVHMSELHVALSEEHGSKAEVLAEQELLGSIATEGEGGNA